ncbi:PadR family transcriptional regulator [Microlunatus parietis]|uniref:DNA-binding PadR family transcriptional regulator n=1 Tax=Microlunatus parietis TaxID=682979 RepID=A0A7Y9ICN3_9ACTN|nr:helix-turn-helix transcriptional regulator [Microlunatus parietis]NYE74364.1 DNA-binding PadR family transcriptional regulator [Microlunatus parietis]
MKLEYILLGVLLGRPRTGYDLKKFLDAHGRFLRSNTQMSQVYRSLTAMAEREWVSYRTESRPGAQDAKIFRVTAEGATVFLDWLTGPYHPPTRFEDPEFGVRLHFAGFLTVDQLLALLDTELEARQRQVAKYRFRDRTEVFEPEVPFDAELAVALNDRMHQYGAAAIDQHIKNLIELRADLLDGRLPVRTPETDPDRKASTR